MEIGGQLHALATYSTSPMNTRQSAPRAHLNTFGETENLLCVCVCGGGDTTLDSLNSLQKE